MPRCSRKGCGQEFDPLNNTQDSCVYHPGAPVFHEGLKSWSCCKTVNKPVLDFDEFMKIPGCERGSHDERAAVEQPKPQPPVNANVNLKMTESTGGTEVYTSSASVIRSKEKLEASPAPAPPVVEEEDDLSVPVTSGTKCRRNGCHVKFVSENESRQGEGEGTICTYHPSAPIFHEGSKGYLCCKRRVLEFDEFLKIEGCKQGRHLFVPKSSKDAVDEPVHCRIDHYQKPKSVHVTIFAKQVDKERSTVKFEEKMVGLDLFLPGNKRFRRSLDLFGPISVSTSSFQILGTKVELHLQKLDGRSWTLLEKTDHDLGNLSLTFGVGGRTGTIGAKEVVLDEQNSTRGSN